MPDPIKYSANQPISTGYVNAAAAGKAQLNGHTVQIGMTPPLNLLKIGTDKIPFQGFRQATKVKRAVVGVWQSSLSTMMALAHPEGPLNCAQLCRSLNTFQKFLDLQVKNGVRMNEMDQVFQSHFAPAVQSINNRTLAAAYSSFLSGDMAALKDSLNKEVDFLLAHGGSDAKITELQNLLSNLFNLEALVICEASKRSLPPEKRATTPTLSQQYPMMENQQRVKAQNLPNPNDMTPVSMKILFNTNTAAANQTEHNQPVVQDFLAKHQIQGISPKDLGDVLRSQEVTINTSIEGLLGLSHHPGRLEHPDQPWTNAFDAPSASKKGIYYQIRDDVEVRTFPELDKRPIKARERPVYAALNHLKRLDGACPSSYGQAVIVLKKTALTQATCTTNDTFNAPKLRLAADSEQRFVDEIASFKDTFSEKAIAELKDPKSQLRQSLHAFFTQLAAKTPELTLEGWYEALTNHKVHSPLLSGTNASFDPYMLKDAALRAMSVSSEENRKAQATYNTIENLLPNLTDITSLSLAHAADEHRQGRDGEPILLTGAPYIEFQLHGPLLLSRDVQEIRVPANELEFTAKDCAAKAKPPQTTEQILAQFQKKFDAFTKATGVPVKIISDEQIAAQKAKIGPTSNAVIDFGKQHQDAAATRQFYQEHIYSRLPEFLVESLQKYHPDDLARLTALLGNPPVLTPAVKERLTNLVDGVIAEQSQKQSLNSLVPQNIKYQVTYKLESCSQNDLFLPALMDTLDDQVRKLLSELPGGADTLTQLGSTPMFPKGASREALLDKCTAKLKEYLVKTPTATLEQCQAELSKILTPVITRKQKLAAKALTLNFPTQAGKNSFLLWVLKSSKLSSVEQTAFIHDNAMHMTHALEDLLHRHKSGQLSPRQAVTAYAQAISPLAKSINAYIAGLPKDERDKYGYDDIAKEFDRSTFLAVAQLKSLLSPADFQELQKLFEAPEFQTANQAIGKLIAAGISKSDHHEVTGFTQTLKSLSDAFRRETGQDNQIARMDLPEPPGPPDLAIFGPDFAPLTIAEFHRQAAK